ncbi:FG-GAP-like repeat-containing protein [Oligoflexia bacterium]|nr:FG-GAP-like repeat-containing protein [Oligoflexia bacterium]
MGITLGTNIFALKAQRQLNGATEEARASYERLSSGMRINSAKDDSAGLSIATSLQTDQRVFTQAIRNGNDGISALAIAEGAVNQLVGIVQRLYELSEQSANGVYTAKQRVALDSEAFALTEEYSRIVNSVEFNGRDLLDGSLTDLRLQLGYGLDGSIAFGLGSGLARTVGDGTFDSEVELAGGNGSGGIEIASGDFNGDGYADIAELTAIVSNVNIHLSNGDGTFQAPVAYNAESAPLGLVSEDLNKDGVLDIMTADRTNGTISVFMGNGDGTFQGKVTYGAVTGARGLAVGDVNGDGIADAVTGSETAAQFAVNLGNGDGTFQAAQTYSTDENNNGNLALADFDRDGDLDIVLAQSIVGNDQLALFSNNGSGGFSDNGQLDGGSFLADVAVGDLNHDGITDIVAVSSATGSMGVNVLIGNEDGSFQSYVNYSAGTTPQRLDLFDIDGDGELDLIFTDNDDSTLNVRIGQKDGTFGSLTSYATGGGPHGVAAGDFNGDGALDITTLNNGDDDLSVFFANTQLRTDMQRLYLLSAEGARESLDILDDTLQRLTAELTIIGSAQSRVFTAVNNLAATRENYAAAESRIIDADVASESANLVKNTVLQNVAAAILAQANQAPRLALDLL